MLRIAVGLMLAAHGVSRLQEGTVNGFGEFLDSKGFMIGPAIAWFLTIFEIVGGLLMAAGVLVQWMAIVFIIELVMGIILVHAQNGWFVVGRTAGGIEYSVLLVLVLLTVAASAKKKTVST